MKKLIIVLTWLTLLVIGLTVSGAWFYSNQRAKSIETQKNLSKELGLACIHHVHNLSAAADAKLKDFYSVHIENPEQYKIEAILSCLQQYPLYEGGETFSGFNTTLN